MGEEKPKEIRGLKESKKSEPTKASTSSSSSGSGSALTNHSSLSPHLAPDREEDDPQDAVRMKRSVRQMEIRPPRPFDPKKDRNFGSLLERIKFHFEVTKCPPEEKTGSLLL